MVRYITVRTGSRTVIACWILAGWMGTTRPKSRMNLASPSEEPKRLAAGWLASLRYDYAAGYVEFQYILYDRIQGYCASFRRVGCWRQENKRGGEVVVEWMGARAQVQSKLH
jgi:hypothetical protein